MPEVTCPCCHGDGVLKVYDAAYDMQLLHLICCHCQGTGKMPAEVEEGKSADENP